MKETNPDIAERMPNVESRGQVFDSGRIKNLSP